MAHLAAELRPGLLGAVALLAITLAPWRVVMSPPEPTATVTVLEGVTNPTWQHGQLREPNGIPNAFDSWDHPDMQAWPRGMVMGVPPIDPGILLRREAVFDNWLSVLLTPLLPSDA